MELDSKVKKNSHDPEIIAANYTKISENLRKLTPQRLQCSIFCGGSRCKYETSKHWAENNLAIKDIFSNWIIEDILAMARPSTSVILHNNVIDQFKSLGIKSIINLQYPREHSSCGQSLEDSGFTYDPNIFMKNDIYYYNFAWEDYGDISLSTLINMVKVLAFSITEGKVAIHCHAGLGRTGVLIASYLVYSLRVSANEAIKYVRHKRPGSVQTSGQIISVRNFALFFLPLTEVFYTSNHFSKDKNTQPFSIRNYLNRQRIVLHGYQERKFKNFPMIIHIICERILQLCNKKTKEFDVTENHLTINFLTENIHENAKTHNMLNNGISNSCSDSLISSFVTPESNFNSDLSTSSGNPSASQNKIVTPKLSASCSDFSNAGESPNKSLSIEKIFEETKKQNQDIEDVKNTSSVKDIVESLLEDLTMLSEELKNDVTKIKNYVNSFQYGYCKINQELNPRILTCLLYDWLDDLKYPILNKKELEIIVVNYNSPENCLKRITLENGLIIEYLLRFVKKMQVSDKEVQKNIIQRQIASLSQKSVNIREVTLPSGKGFQKLREGTLNCVLKFCEHLMEKISV